MRYLSFNITCCIYLHFTNAVAIKLLVGTPSLYSNDRHGLREKPHSAGYVDDHQETGRFAKGAESGERGCILAPVF
jgi:hypothetical protein